MQPFRVLFPGPLCFTEALDTVHSVCRHQMAANQRAHVSAHGRVRLTSVLQLHADVGTGHWLYLGQLLWQVHL